MVHNNQDSLRKYGYIAGVGFLVAAVITIFANHVVMESLIIPGDIALTAFNLFSESQLFSLGIFALGVSIILNFLITWALYAYFIPAHQELSSIAAGLRIAFGITFAVALISLLQILVALEANTGTEISVELAHRVVRLTERFNSIRDFAFVFLGIHLVLLGFLVSKSEHISNVLALILIVSGIGYSIDSIAGIDKFHVPSYLLGIDKFAFIGELLFMLWLLFSAHYSKTRKKI